MFFAASFSAIRIEVVAPVVDRSTKRRTRFPVITPPSPVATASTIGGVGKLANTVSAASATSATEPTTRAPNAANSLRAFSRVSVTTSLCPASISRRAIGAPISPRPMNPASSLMTLLSSIFARVLIPQPLLAVDFREDLAGGAEAVDCRRHPAIDRNLQKNLADFLAGQAVVQRTFQVHLELVRPVESGEHGKIEKAAGPAIEALAPPLRAPAIFGH